MEALSSLAFKGSIPEAIFEAKRQKKLFVVYISGEDEESAKLNESTWTDAKVSESLSKCCILLHIQSGSADAANFSAIYPYSSIPCIAAIGFNGAQVWKNEGFINADVLASSLEKAWLSLHIQETTASILSAALASQKSEASASSVSNVALPSEGGSSDAAVVSPSIVTGVQPSERESKVTSGSTKGNDALERESTVASGSTNGNDAYKNAEKVVDNKDYSKSVESRKPGDIANDKPASSVQSAKDLGNVERKETSLHVEAEEPVRPATSKPRDDTSGSRAVRGSDAGERDIKLVNSIGTEESETPKDEVADEKSTEKKDVLSTNKSSDVHLNIRLPNGTSLQEKFSVTSTLRTVKDYVSSNQMNGMGAYDLAIPYPRKVFSDQDLDKSLSEVGLFNRQALIVVPRQRATAYHGGESYPAQTSSASNNARSENPSNGGYFAYLRRLMSYANPFSYFSGGASSSSSGPESQTSIWEYGPNPGLRNNLAQMGRHDRDVSSTRNPSEGTSNVRNRRPTTSRIGSNIHTLKHDEDDVPFGGDRNAFWNGNSTQYGGDNSDDNRR